MNREIGQYLEALKAALGGADPATIQDALADAEEHLTLASQRETAGGDGRSFASIIAEYGSPEEIAATYRELETRTPLPFSDTAPAGGGRPFWRRFFGVAADLRAYACLFYLFASLALGILYFTIAMTGISLSLGLLVLIIGIPFVVGFLTAVRGIAVVEGRIVEALLGVRMPRTPVFIRKDLKWNQRIARLFSDGSTWTAIVYFILMMPLGIVYFTLALVLLSLSLVLFTSPFFLYVLGFPLFEAGRYAYYPPYWMLPLFVASGVLFYLLTLHFAKWMGRVHGRFAKVMLVRAK